MVSIITMILTPFILNNIKKIANVVEDKSNTELNPLSFSKPTIKDHIVIFGYGRLGQEVVQRIKNTGVPYLVLESDLNLVELGISRGENICFANAAQEETLKIANIEQCSVVVITVGNEAKLDMLYQSIANYPKPIQTIVLTSGNLEKILFSNANNFTHIIKAEQALARTLVQEALECRIQKSN